MHHCRPPFIYQQQAVEGSMSATAENRTLFNAFTCWDRKYEK